MTVKTFCCSSCSSTECSFFCFVSVCENATALYQDSVVEAKNLFFLVLRLPSSSSHQGCSLSVFGVRANISLLLSSLSPSLHLDYVTSLFSQSRATCVVGHARPAFAHDTAWPNRTVGHAGKNMAQGPPFRALELVCFSIEREREREFSDCEKESIF